MVGLTNHFLLAFNEILPSLSGSPAVGCWPSAWLRIFWSIVDTARCLKLVWLGPGGLLQISGKHTSVSGSQGTRRNLRTQDSSVWILIQTFHCFLPFPTIPSVPWKHGWCERKHMWSRLYNMKLITVFWFDKQIVEWADTKTLEWMGTSPSLWTDGRRGFMNSHGRWEHLACSGVTCWEGCRHRNTPLASR